MKTLDINKKGYYVCGMSAYLIFSLVCSLVAVAFTGFGAGVALGEKRSTGAVVQPPPDEFDEDIITDVHYIDPFASTTYRS